MAKNRIELINRKEYEHIRKMDHGQMSEYMAGIHQKGYEAGAASVSKLRPGELRDVLFSIKGIGGAKADAIVAAILAAEEVKEKGSR